MTHLTMGVIGAGRIGRMHTENLVLGVPEAYVKTVAGRTVDGPWAAELGVSVSTQDVDVLLGDKEIQAVVIAVPSGHHVEMIQRAASAGKQIFCEKPIAFDEEKIQEALAAAEKAGVQLQVGFNRRFDPSIRELQQAVARGDVGDLESVRVTNRDPKAPEIEFVRGSGGLFFDFAIHDFDTLRFLSGSEIVEVYAAGAALVNSEIGVAGDIDTAVITARLENGALCVIDNSRETHYGYDQRFEAFGSKGNLAVGNLRPTTVVASLESGVYRDKPCYSFVERYREAFVAELREFVLCVRDEKPVRATAEDAMAAVRAAGAAQKSMLENRPVRLAEIGHGEG